MAQPLYPYLVRRPGYRGRTVAHLADERGEARCGLSLGERWELARATSRSVCERCRTVAEGPDTKTQQSSPGSLTRACEASLDLILDEVYALAETLGERDFLYAPRDSPAWDKAARKVIRVWRKRQQGNAGSSPKGAAGSRRK